MLLEVVSKVNWRHWEFDK